MLIVPTTWYCRHFFKKAVFPVTKKIRMAKSKYEYVKLYEQEPTILSNCWFVVRIDGKNFHRFAKVHDFQRPNDPRALELMNFSATMVMKEFKDIVLAFGHSDEYSFIFQRATEIFNRRVYKIVSYVNSYFTASYVFNWKHFFPNSPMKYPAYFDSRVVLYPTDDNLKDYLKWRQADVHINNLYNTIFWALVDRGHLTNTEAEKKLCGSTSADKNELLFSQFNINYNNEPIMFRKGTILVRKIVHVPSLNQEAKLIIPLHESLIDDAFWVTHHELLSGKPVPKYNFEPEQQLPDLIEQQIRLFKT